MTKHKRDAAWEEKRAKRQSPFAVHDGNEDDFGQGEDILRCMLLFDQYSMGGKASQDECFTAVARLISHLEETIEQQHPSQNGGVETLGTGVSASEIASLLLPWIVRSVLASNQQTPKQVAVLWKAFGIALKILIAETDAQFVCTLSKDALSQSTLFKLAPTAALVATKPSYARDEHPDFDVVNNAACVYRMLVEYLFRPTLDVAIKSLLIPIMDVLLRDEEMESNGDAIKSFPSAEDKDVATATVNLIYQLLESRKGNAKTTFQLLANDSSLVALSKASVFLSEAASDTDNSNAKLHLQAVVSDGLFHPQHHMEGFYSLLMKGNVPDLKVSLRDNARPDSKPKFRSYQDELFASVELGMTPSLDQDVSVPKLLFSVTILPNLFCEFLKQSIVWNRQYRESRGRDSRKDDIAVIQFRCFARWAILVLKVCRNEKVKPFLRVESIGALRKMVDALFEFDTYSPSQSDLDGAHFAFMNALSVEVLQMPAMLHDDYLSEDILRQCSMIFQKLLMMNHLLLHERLADIICFGLAPSSETAQLEVEQLFVLIGKIYKQLRQQEHIFRSIMQAVDSCQSRQDIHGLQQICKILQRGSVAAAISDSIQACPIAQAKEVFLIMKNWLANDDKYGSTALLEDSLWVAVELIVLATRNVRVDRTTANVISDICQQMMDDCVARLMSRVDFLPNRKVPALILSGWLLELQTRCVFWFGRTAPLTIPPSVLEELTCLSKNLEIQGVDISPELARASIFLACHRLRQLRLLILEFQIEAMGLAGEEARKIEYEYNAEGDRLAAFVVSASEKATGNVGNSGWAIVAQNFASWIPYANEEQVRWFLKSMLSSIVGAQTSVESEMSMLLLSDDSFMASHLIASNLATVALSVASRRITISILGSTSRLADELDEFVSMKECSGTRWPRPIRSVLLRIASSTSPTQIHEVNFDTTLSGLKSALRLILIINGIPFVTTNDPRYFLVLALKLDHLCRSLKSTQHRLAKVSMSLVSSLRFAMAKIINASDPSWQVSLSDEFAISGGLISSAISFASTRETATSWEARELLSQTGRLVVYLRLPSIGQWRDEVKSAVDSLHRRAVDQQDLSGELALSILGQSLLRELQAVFNDKPHDDQDLNLLFPIIEGLHSVSKSLCDTALDARSDSRNRRPEGFLLLADVLRINRQIGRYEWTDDVEKLAVVCLRELEGITSSNTHWNYWCYILGSIVHSNPSVDLCKQVVEFVIERKEDHPILHGVLFTCARSVPSSVVIGILGKLSCESVLRGGCRLKFVNTLLHYPDSFNLSEIFSESGKHFFNHALALLHGESKCERWAENVQIACTTLDGFFRRRDVLHFNESDLALLLSRLAVVLSASFVDTDASQMNAVVSACTILLTSIFHRYSKPLYTCAPSFLSVLHCLLSCMLATSSMSEEIALEQGQRFGRICEMLVPHRDIFKKHIVGLVLEFIHGLQNPKLSLPRRENLLPSMFYLLDSLSPFEMKEINAQMDNSSKTAFRGIYNKYQRTHIFKGQ